MGRRVLHDHFLARNPDYIMTFHNLTAPMTGLSCFGYKPFTSIFMHQGRDHICFGYIGPIAIVPTYTFIFSCCSARFSESKLHSTW
jgi:hypothetical protein